MDDAERTTGTRDEHYNLVSVLYHALHGAENCEIYAVDAEAAGDARLGDFFREAQEMQRQLAERAKELLGMPGGGVRPETAVPGVEVPPEGIVGPEPTPGDVTRGTEPEPPPPRTTGIEEGIVVGREEAPPSMERVPPRTEEAAPPGREDARQPERDREEDKGLIDRAKDAILGEEEEPRRRREGTDR